jgi:hypothetical protein
MTDNMDTYDSPISWTASFAGSISCWAATDGKASHALFATVALILSFMQSFFQAIAE